MRTLPKHLQFEPATKGVKCCQFEAEGDGTEHPWEPFASGPTGVGVGQIQAFKQR